ncbi:MAG TPA: CRISPR-associated protein Cas4 [Alphaproteobacteria bacterium]|nr:CRISPR-associated protein Cas4 [Alphaproteobacteria bacterium]
MVTATQLSSYLYCPRKLFMTTVLSLESPPKEELVKGKIWHETFELINTGEEAIVSSISEKKSYPELFDIYRKYYSKYLRNAIIKNKSGLKEFNLSMIELFKDYWPGFENEAKNRALNLSNFMNKHEVYGQELWKILTPKILSEQYYKSEKLNLSGVIDVIEIHNTLQDDKKIYLPIELKTGKVPSKGMWDGHRVQLAAYIMLLEDKGYESTEGVLQYKDADDRRVLQMNSLLRDEVLDLIRAVNKLISDFTLPDYVDNRNKCKTCPFKETCYNSSEMKTLLDQAKLKKESVKTSIKTETELKITLKQAQN